MFDMIMNMYVTCSKQDAEKDVSDIHVALVELPTQRYVRRVAKTPLDLLSK